MPPTQISFPPQAQTHKPQSGNTDLDTRRYVCVCRDETTCFNILKRFEIKPRPTPEKSSPGGMNLSQTPTERTLHHPRFRAKNKRGELSPKTPSSTRTKKYSTCTSYGVKRGSKRIDMTQHGAYLLRAGRVVAPNRGIANPRPPQTSKTPSTSLAAYLDAEHMLVVGARFAAVSRFPFVSPSKRRRIRLVVLPGASEEAQAVGADPLDKDARVNGEPEVAHGVREDGDQRQHLSNAFREMR